MEKCAEGERVEKMEHFSHPHPLVLKEWQSKEGAGDHKQQQQHCSACLEPLFGPTFSCELCCDDEFRLHKFCAEAPPSQITHSPYHRKHPSLTLHKNVPSSWPYICDFCKETRPMFVYRCSYSDNCYFCLDIKCALLLHNINIDENYFRELKYLGHQHPLTFINPNDHISEELVKSRADCYWCQKPVVVDSPGYACSKLSNCRFYLHKKCARLPAQVYHPCHRKHPLYIEDADLVCGLCEREHWSFFYRCLPCKFDVDIECVQSRPRSIVECQSNHEHSFNLVLRPDPFICDACGIKGNYISCTCSICHVMIHEKCVSLPRILKTTRHHHYLIHNFFFQREEEQLENRDCGNCLNEVDMVYGSYKCLKPDCNYVSHVHCALEMYDVIDQEGEDESSEYLARHSSITCVIERNDNGEAIKVKHFSHDHDLTLGTNKIEDNDKHCDGCMLSISFSTEEEEAAAAFYYCSDSQCDFLLHKACAELPRKTHHWFHRSLTTLEPVEEIFKCSLCNRLCSGFAYKSTTNEEMPDPKYFCLRCARISHAPNFQGHNHTLLYDFKFEGQCNACGATCGNGAFICKHCTGTGTSSFALDFACITLPHVARYKRDGHPLKLTFLDENDDPEQHRCDICEEKKDPNYRFYHCTICDNSAHPQCVLGKYPFIKNKIGAAFPYYDHPHIHSLFVVKKNIYDMCTNCGKPLEDVALECQLCKPSYVIHLDCWSWQGRYFS